MNPLHIITLNEDGRTDGRQDEVRARCALDGEGELLRENINANEARRRWQG